MTSVEWLQIDSPASLLAFARLTSKRKLKLVAAAMARIHHHRYEKAEPYIDKLEDLAELPTRKSNRELRALREELAAIDGWFYVLTDSDPFRAIANYLSTDRQYYHKESGVSCHLGVYRTVCCDLLRDVSVDPYILAQAPQFPRWSGWGWNDQPSAWPWATPQVVQLATAAYQNRVRYGEPFHLVGVKCRDVYYDGTLDPDALRALFDAMEEAGCTDPYRLNHFRHGLHCRGCWVLDEILGKE